MIFHLLRVVFERLLGVQRRRLNARRNDSPIPI